MADTSEKFTFWHAVLLIEGTAAVIAIVSTLVPGRTGMRSPVAELFFEQPTFIDKLVVNLVGINVIVLLVVLVIGLFWRLRGRTGKAENGE